MRPSEKLFLQGYNYSITRELVPDDNPYFIARLKKQLQPDFIRVFSGIGITLDIALDDLDNQVSGFDIARDKTFGLVGIDDRVEIEDDISSSVKLIVDGVDKLVNQYKHKIFIYERLPRLVKAIEDLIVRHPDPRSTSVFEALKLLHEINEYEENLDS